MARKGRGDRTSTRAEKGRGAGKAGHESRIRELEDRIVRIQADFENYRKSLEKQRAEYESRASERIMSDLLDVVDDLTHAARNAGDEGRGFRLILDKLMAVLGRHGLRPIETKGKPFDHYYHEAVMSQKSEEEEGTVLEELQKGFMLNSRVLRHSKVKVAKK